MFGVFCLWGHRQAQRHCLRGLHLCCQARKRSSAPSGRNARSYWKDTSGGKGQGIIPIVQDAAALSSLVLDRGASLSRTLDRPAYEGLLTETGGLSQLCTPLPELRWLFTGCTSTTITKLSSSHEARPALRSNDPGDGFGPPGLPLRSGGSAPGRVIAFDNNPDLNLKTRLAMARGCANSTKKLTTLAISLMC